MKLTGLTLAEAALHLLKGDDLYRSHPTIENRAEVFYLIDGKVIKSGCGYISHRVEIDISSEEFDDTGWYLSAEDFIY